MDLMTNIQSNIHNNVSNSNKMNEYLTKYSLFQQTKPLRVVLKPGNCLYLPVYWHHEVQSLPTSTSTEPSMNESVNDSLNLNIAINFWFKNMTLPIDDMQLINS